MISPSPSARRALVLALAVGIGGVGGVALVASPHWALATILVFGFGTLCALRPHLAVPALLVYATVLGFTRRYVSYTFDTFPTLDPLILVLPVGGAILAAMAVNRGALRDRTRLTTIVLILLGLAVIGALNPLQGSPMVGAAGLVFFGAPLLWFFVGRSLCTDDVLARTYRWVAVTVLASSLYGLAQSAGAFTAFDRAWSEATNFQLGGELRPFGWSSSPGEYARMLAVAVVILVAAMGQRRLSQLRWFVLPLLLLPLLAALAFASVRSTLVYLVLALAVAAAARRRVSIATTAVAGVLSLALLLVAASTIGGSFGGDSVDPALARQVEGLANPTDSTATARFDLLGRALVQSVGQPIGQGTGITTRAAARGGSAILITESDLGDAAVSWGIPGVVAFAAFLVTALVLLIRLAGTYRSWLAPATLAIFMVATLRWVNGGLYPLAPLVLLGLGWADRRWQRRAVADDAELEAAAT